MEPFGTLGASSLTSWDRFVVSSPPPEPSSCVIVDFSCVISDEILSRRFVWLCVFCTDVVVLCFFRIFVGFQLIIMDLGVIVSSVFGIFPNWCFPHIM